MSEWEREQHTSPHHEQERQHERADAEPRLPERDTEGNDEAGGVEEEKAEIEVDDQ